MIIYEFYLRDVFKAEVFETLCEGFYSLPNPAVRKVDGQMGSAVYAISRNPATHWVQLLVDDNTPPDILTAIEARIKGLSDGVFVKYTSDQDNVAPMEGIRGE